MTENMSPSHGPLSPDSCENSTTPAGQIILVGTPIGNLGDLSSRAIETLNNADVIACEDTRRTRALLTHCNITGKRLIATHEHNESASADGIVALAREGKTIAVVSDSGMPAISDPGTIVVQRAVAARIPLTVVPGPSATVTAVALSGFVGPGFRFVGFLPAKGSERAAELSRCAEETAMAVLYEAPHRLERTLADLLSVCGRDRNAVLFRELTKLHETCLRGTLGRIAECVTSANHRGECVLVLEGRTVKKITVDDGQILQQFRHVLSTGKSKKDAVREVAFALNVSKNRVASLVHRDAHDTFTT